MKILILTEHMHNRIGGIETYTRLLMDLFHNQGHEISEFSLDLKFNKIIDEEKPFVKQLYRRTTKFNWLLDIRKITKKIEELSKEYDVIINQINNVPWSKNIYSSNNWIFVQHFSYRFFKQEFIAGKILAPIIYFGMWLFKIKNPFKHFKNLVVFSENDFKELNIKSKKVFIVPLAKYTLEEIKEFRKNKRAKRTPFLYLGRISNGQKNLNFIQKTVGKNNDIDFYGNGKISIIKKQENLRYKGVVASSDIPGILQEYKWLILLSKYEGFPFILVESISCGVPALVSDSFGSSKFLTQDFSFLVKNKKKDVNMAVSKIKKITDYEYNNKVKMCFDFAENNLTLDKFYDKWISILAFFNVD